MIYRAVKSNASDEVLAIGRDESQGGQDYHDIGTWCSWTFTDMVYPSMELMKAAEGLGYQRSLMKVSGESIIEKNIEEIQ